MSASDSRMVAGQQRLGTILHNGKRTTITNTNQGDNAMKLFDFDSQDEAREALAELRKAKQSVLDNGGTWRDVTPHNIMIDNILQHYGLR